MEIPTDEELKQQLLDLQEKCHWQVPESLRGFDLSSFFDDKQEEEEC